MIDARDAIAAAHALMGTPYSEMDCINLIKRVIRDAPGGVKGYTTAGTNALWRSYDQVKKYRDLIWRQEGIQNAQAGMLAFKARGEDIHHVGLVSEGGMVIHSSSTQGGRGVVKTPLTKEEGWTHLAKHRYIRTQSGGQEEEIGEAQEAARYTARVALEDAQSRLNIRSGPGKEYAVIGRLRHGERVNVAQESGGWARLDEGAGVGYASAAYLVREAAQEEQADEKQANEEEANETGRIRIVDESGRIFMPEGRFTAEIIQGE